MKKNIPYMPAYTSPRAAFAVDRVGWARSLSGRIGSCARRSVATNVASKDDAGDQ